MSRREIPRFGCALALVWATQSAAIPLAVAEVEIGFFGGYHAFARDSELGAEDESFAPAPKAGPLGGARVAIGFANRFAIEIEGAVVPTKDDVIGDDAMVTLARGHFRADLLTGGFRPFLLVGGGAYRVSDAPQLFDDTDGTLHWGGGLRLQLGSHVDLRVDGRHIMVPNRDEGGLTYDVEVSAGISFRFGGGRRRPIVVAPPPTAQPVAEPVPAPSEPAPIPVATVEPAVPVDSDGDSLLPPADACPTEAEDRDGVRDEDGCPDPDNDEDGVLDINDKCPGDKEIKNDFRDDDGCSDELLSELAGVRFVSGRSRLTKDSTRVLERARRLMQENPSMRIEVAGHTSNDGSARSNLRLSLARAEEIKKWLIRAGIADDRILTVGHGAGRPIDDNDTAKGRDRNRRIEFRVVATE